MPNRIINVEFTAVSATIANTMLVAGFFSFHSFVGILDQKVNN